MAKKNLFFEYHTLDVFLFVAAIVTIVVLFIIWKHIKLKSLVTSLAFKQTREVGTVTKQKHF